MKLISTLTIIDYVVRQVQKSDRSNSDHQSGLDQLGLTRIDSDHRKNIINKEMRLSPI